MMRCMQFFLFALLNFTLFLFKFKCVFVLVQITFLKIYMLLMKSKLSMYTASQN